MRVFALGTMNWQKLGLIFIPTGQQPWLRSHATNPVVLHLDADRYRVYFASRDERNRSHVGFIELDVRNPHETLHVSETPALGPGPLGYFDDHGVYASSIVADGKRLYLYYIGWNPGLTQPMFYTSIGVAVSHDGGCTFERMFKSPILARSEFDPWMVSGPFVLREGSVWRMWYISGLGWETTDQGDFHSFYHLKYAESQDGIHWKREGMVTINLLPGERNICRPSILKEDSLYKMWYGVNSGEGYRIGYAESADGYEWVRRDSQAGLDVSPYGWDSKSTAYPWVFAHGEKKYMLYNGNDQGRDGVGLAVRADLDRQMKRGEVGVFH